MSDDLAIGDWQDWLQSPATRAFFAHIEREWGAGGRRFESTVDRLADSREDDPIVLKQIQQIAVCRREILRLVRWPSEEVSRLKQLAHPDVSAHPRPQLAPDLVGQSRRGGL